MIEKLERTQTYHKARNKHTKNLWTMGATTHYELTTAGVLLNVFASETFRAVDIPETTDGIVNPEIIVNIEY